MTAAEKREWFVSQMISAINTPPKELKELVILKTKEENQQVHLMECAKVLIPDDDPEPAKDWRDEVVEGRLGWYGWVKDVSPQGVPRLTRSDSVFIANVYADGSAGLWRAGTDACLPLSPNNDPLSRCRLIDAFLAGLEGKA